MESEPLWIQDHPPLCSGRNIAERRLKEYDYSLKKTVVSEEYAPVLIEWIHEDAKKLVKFQS